MRQFLIKLLLIVIPIVLFFFSCEYLLRSVPNDYNYKNHWLETKSSLIKILNVGSSHGYYGIIPGLFPVHAFNAAHVSQSLKYDAYIVKRFVPQMDSLKILILPLSYGSMVSDLETSLESWRVKKYTIYYHCPYHHSYEYRYAFEMADFNLMAFRRMVKYYVTGKIEQYCDMLGFGTAYKLEYRSKQWKETGEIAARRHTKSDMTFFCENMSYLYDIAEVCMKQQVQLVIITTPTYITYRRNLKTEQLNAMYEAVRLLQNKYPKVLYMDLMADKRFFDVDFYDADHLNTLGAQKLTLLLKDTLLLE